MQRSLTLSDGTWPKRTAKSPTSLPLAPPEHSDFTQLPSTPTPPPTPPHPTFPRSNLGASMEECLPAHRRPLKSHIPKAHLPSPPPTTLASHHHPPTPHPPVYCLFSVFCLLGGKMCVCGEGKREGGPGAGGGGGGGGRRFMPFPSLLLLPPRCRPPPPPSFPLLAPLSKPFFFQNKKKYWKSKKAFIWNDYFFLIFAAARLRTPFHTSLPSFFFLKNFLSGLVEGLSMVTLAKAKRKRGRGGAVQGREPLLHKEK